jgi:hypothetical protein
MCISLIASVGLGFKSGRHCSCVTDEEINATLSISVEMLEVEYRYLTLSVNSSDFRWWWIWKRSVYKGRSSFPPRFQRNKNVKRKRKHAACCFCRGERKLTLILTLFDVCFLCRILSIIPSLSLYWFFRFPFNSLTSHKTVTKDIDGWTLDEDSGI